MDAHAEASSDVRHVAVAVGAGEQSEAVYYEAVCLAGLLGCRLGVSHGLAPCAALYLPQVVFAYLVWRYDELPLSVLLEVGHESVAVWRPAAARHEYARAVCERLDDGQALRLLLNLEHTVKACVAGHGHVGDSYGCEQVAAHFVLHVEAGYAAQHLGVAPGVAAEEHLSRAEYA